MITDKLQVLFTTQIQRFETRATQEKMLTLKSPPIVNWLMVVLHSISLSHGQPSMACSRDCDNTVICLADPLLGVHQSIYTASTSARRLAPSEQKKKVELRFFFLQVCHLIGRLCESYGELEVFDEALG